MSNLTKKAIREAFLKLLHEKPYSTITVKDIVSECGLNRNTFYYHYNDIPTLLDVVIKDDCDRIIQSYPSLSSLEECLELAVSFAKENERSVIHIYNSVDRTIFENNLWRICDYAVRTYFDNVIGADEIESTDEEIIINFYKCECFGQVMAWMDSGMKADISRSIKRLYELRKGQLEDLVERCRKK